MFNQIHNLKSSKRAKRENLNETIHDLDDEIDTETRNLDNQVEALRAIETLETKMPTLEKAIKEKIAFTQSVNKQNDYIHEVLETLEEERSKINGGNCLSDTERTEFYFMIDNLVTELAIDELRKNGWVLNRES